MLTAAQTKPGSGVPRRLLGRCLRDLRLAARLPVKTAAVALEWSEPKLWRIETGQTRLRALDVEAMCALYGAPPDLTQALAGLARRHNAQSWWHSHGEAAPGSFDVHTKLEEQACELLGYESGQIPPLLRTAPYARTMITGSRPGASAEEIDSLVRECLARQVLVTRAGAPLSVTLILGEALVRCPVGGAQVMAGQLRYLAEMAGLPNVRLRVVPFSAGQHPGLRTGPFTLLRFPPNGREAGPPTVCVPGLTGELYLDKPDEARCYATAHAGIAPALAFHNCVWRYIYALGRERVLPAALGRTGGNNIPKAASLTQSITGLAVISGYALTGQDPMVRLFFWLGTSGGYGVLLLLTLTAVAIVAFFARDPRGENAWRRLIAPGIAAVLLGGLVVLATLHYATLLGVPPGTPIAWILPASYLTVAVIGEV